MVNLCMLIFRLFFLNSSYVSSPISKNFSNGTEKSGECAVSSISFVISFAFRVPRTAYIPSRPTYIIHSHKTFLQLLTHQIAIFTDIAFFYLSVCSLTREELTTSKIPPLVSVTIWAHIHTHHFKRLDGYPYPLPTRICTGAMWLG